ncbi:MAG: hypothetical protein ACTSXU_01375 [Promethearchaeota archaeon]
MVNWPNIEAKPEKEHKILGQVLLDMRTEIFQKKNQVNSLTSKVNELQNVLSTSNSKLNAALDREKQLV